MADFCKEADFDWHDFSIKEEFDKLDEGYQISMICEKLGFIGIAKEKGVCEVAMPREPREGEIVEPGHILIDWHEFCFETNRILPLKVSENSPTKE